MRRSAGTARRELFARLWLETPVLLTIAHGVVTLMSDANTKAPVHPVRAAGGAGHAAGEA